MSSERISSGGERNEQAAAELEAARAERLAEIRETAAEHDPAAHAEKRAERAAEKAREAIEIHAAEPEPNNTSETETPHTGRQLPFLNQHLNYAQTVASMQRHLRPISRSFSKVIHTPAIETASEALEKTVARPSVLLGATWTALIVGSAFYLIARHYGFALSGSELIFSFIVGAVLGLVLEGLWRGLRRR
ncbi:MAG TPA: hypothetical protein VMT30_00910 [Candidatus Saccharimonadia bacterium]|nr:hypothetical protein [Candidatus Saccharimonadia bacterium]